MVRFVKLEIRGLRSVGDRDEDVHIFEFLSPCTLINGPNGTGKTTCIEALNYVTTGVIPVRMQSFIHSTDMAKKSRVDASVKLEFVDFKRRTCIAIRRMCLTASGKATSEEHNLIIKFPDGSSQSISSKVADFNKAVLFHLGVPKAILNLVIFCHQEESTWPLCEPKELKLKFDEIFQLTKFVKAQERIKKLTMGYKKERDVMLERQGKLEKFVEDKLEAKKIRAECENRNERGKLKMEECKKKKAEIEKLKTELDKMMREIDMNINNMTKLELELKHLQEQFNYIRVEPYCGTEMELRQEIRALEQSSGVADFEDEKHKIVRKMQMNEQEKNQLMRNKEELEGKIKELAAKNAIRSMQSKELAKLEDELRDGLSFYGDVHESILTENLTILEAKMDSEVDEKRKEQADSNILSSKNQETLSRMKFDINNKKELERKLKDEVKELEKKLKKGESASKGINQLNSLEESLKAKLNQLPEFDENSMEKCISTRNSAQKMLEELKKESSEAEKVAQKRKEIHKLNKEVEEEEKVFKELMKKHEDNFDVVFPDGKPKNGEWTSAVSEVTRNVRNDLKSKQAAHNKASLQVQTLKNMQQQLQQDEERLTNSELVLSEKIFDECSFEPEEITGKLADLKKKLARERKRLAPLSAKNDIYEEYIEQIETSKCCPLCDRGFKSPKLAKEFFDKVKNSTLSFPSEIENQEKIVSKYEKEEGTLMKSEMDAKQLLSIQKELKEKREKRMKNDEELSKYVGIEKKEKKEMDEVVKIMTHIEALQADVGAMNQHYKQITRLRNELDTKKRSTIGFDDVRDVEEIQKELDEQEKKYRKAVKDSDEIQQVANQRNSLQTQINTIGADRVAMGEAATQLHAITEQLNIKASELNECVKLLSELKIGLPQAEKAKEMARRDHTRKSEAAIEADSLKKSTISGLKQKMSEWSRRANEVKKSANCDIELSTKEEGLKEIVEKIEENAQRTRRFQADMTNLNGTQNNGIRLKDQLRRFELNAKIKKLEEEKNQMASVGGSYQQLNEMRQRWRDYDEKMKTLNGDEIRYYTKLQENEKRLKEALDKLKRREIVEAETNYRDVVLEIAILEESANDLEKYRKCLDISLIQFHTEKMEAVNAIIDDLWRKVYNSTDITTIRVKSDTNAESAKNRAYDYKVVMVQENGAEVEMRGRCSAGQKMLASLLIRIALSEVFGGLCSMIALDEPTTNLDDSKVDGMADILNDLISARSGGYDSCSGERRGKDMQMVVITHDERLVNRLTLGCKPDYVYRLGKDEHGISYLNMKMPNGHEVRVNNHRK